MESKFIEIRDAGTFIPALAIQISGEDGYLARRAGFGATPCVYLIMLESACCAYDPYGWVSGARTMQVAHLWIGNHWGEIADGMVVDVEFILGITSEPKASARKGNSI